MNLPIPESEEIKKAMKWIAFELKSDPSKKRFDLIMKASVNFDLSPVETEYLLNSGRFENDKD